MTKPKIKICSGCNREIAAASKLCPFCGEKFKKPFYRKPIFWILIIFVLLIGSCSSHSTAESDATNPTSVPSSSISSKQESVPDVSTSEQESATYATELATETTTEPSAPLDVYCVGDIFQDGGLELVYVASGDYIEENSFLQPSDGMKYIYLEFAATNTSSKSDLSINTFSFDCYADGYACEKYYGGDNDLSATLSFGRSTTGCVYFTVPTDAEKIEVEYSVNFFSKKKITFAYQGNQKSDYTLQVNQAATEGALQVGETIESKSLNITYLDCYEDKSDNMFITAKENYRFITCEFEFENKSSSDEFVSSFSFDCFADGVSCEGSYFRDDTLSATISSGRKAKGTVTFEVPVNATIIEIEYLTNYWTSNRVVFNANPFQNVSAQ